MSQRVFTTLPYYKGAVPYMVCHDFFLSILFCVAYSDSFLFRMPDF